MAADPFEIKKDDTYPPLIRTLEQTIDGDLTPIDLTGYVAVKVILKRTTPLEAPADVPALDPLIGTYPVITGTCTVSNVAGGEVTYNWATGDTLYAGTYYTEWEITWPGPKYETVPNDGFYTVIITADLGGTV